MAKDDSSVEVKGDVKGTAYGVSATGNSTIDVGGNVESELRSVNAGRDSSVSVGGNVTSATQEGVIANNQSQVTVAGSVKSEGEAVRASGNSSVSIGGNAESDGPTINAYDNSTVSIGGNVINTDSAGAGVSAHNNSTVNVSGDVTTPGVGVWAENSSTVTVGGNVEADEMFAASAGSGSTVTVEGNAVNKSSDAVSVSDNGKVTVKGDATGERYGIYISESGNSSDGAAVVLGTVTAGDNNDSYCINVSSDALTKQEVLDELPTIIVGELSSKNGQFVNFTDNSGQGTLDSKEVAQAIAEQILYYIDVQDTKNGNIKIDSGTSKVEGYDVAHASDTVTVTVTADRGYEIQTVGGGKATAVKNEDGSWNITVPATGGVSISAIMAAIRQVEDNSGGGGDDGGNTNTKTNDPPEYVSEKTADGSSVHVYGETTAPDGTAVVVF